MRLGLLIGICLRACGRTIARLLGKTVAFEFFVAQLRDDRCRYEFGDHVKFAMLEIVVDHERTSGAPSMTKPSSLALARR